MNAQKMLEAARELGTKRGYVLGFYLATVRTVKLHMERGATETVPEVEPFDPRGVGGILHAICNGIIELNLPYESYLALFPGLFQNELFNNDEFSKQYSVEYHRLCEFYNQEIPIDNGSHLVGDEHSPFRAPYNKSAEQQ